MRTTWERRRQILPQTSEEKQLLAENQELERRLQKQMEEVQSQEEALQRLQEQAKHLQSTAPQRSSGQSSGRSRPRRAFGRCSAELRTAPRPLELRVQSQAELGRRNRGTLGWKSRMDRQGATGPEIGS
eukprot:g18433.t1